MKVPLVRGCGCVHEDYRGIQYLVKECSTHAKDLMRSREHNRAIINNRLRWRK